MIGRRRAGREARPADRAGGAGGRDHRAGPHTCRPRRAARAGARSRRPSSTSPTPPCCPSGSPAATGTCCPGGLQDRLHQERRSHLFPRSFDLASRARELGALGATISGAGPTVLVWCFYEQTGSVAGRPGTGGRGLGAPDARPLRTPGGLRPGEAGSELGDTPRGARSRRTWASSATRGAGALQLGQALEQFRQPAPCSRPPRSGRWSRIERARSADSA